MKADHRTWTRFIAHAPLQASAAIAAGWFGLNFASVVFHFRGLFSWSGLVFGSLYRLQMYLYEVLFAFDTSRTILPGVGVFVRTERVLLFILGQSAIIFIACWLLGGAVFGKNNRDPQVDRTS